MGMLQKKAWIKNVMSGFPIYESARQRSRKTAEKEWALSGQSGCPPHLVKEHAVIEHAKVYGTKIMVETGTLYGDMIAAVRSYFKNIYSIELEPTLCADAQNRFKSYKSVTIIEGDSGVKLPELVNTLNEPALFWLDGHYSGGITARGEIDTPVSAEVDCILSHSVRNHAILIDDAHEFTGENDYPTLEALESAVHAVRPDMSFSVKHNIIFILPPKPNKG